MCVKDVVILLYTQASHSLPTPVSQVRVSTCMFHRTFLQTDIGDQFPKLQSDVFLSSTDILRWLWMSQHLATLMATRAWLHHQESPWRTKNPSKGSWNHRHLPDFTMWRESVVKKTCQSHSKKVVCTISDDHEDNKTSYIYIKTHTASRLLFAVQT